MAKVEPVVFKKGGVVDAAATVEEGSETSAGSEEVSVNDLVKEIASLRDVVDAQGKATKRLEMENQELRQEVDLLKRGLVANQTQGKLEKVRERDGDADEGEEEELEDFWALVDLPRPSETSAAHVAFQAYAYTGMHAAVNGIVLVAFLEWFPVTNYKSGAGVPVMNVDVSVSRWYPILMGAEALGASFNIISNWESGVRDGDPCMAFWPAFPIAIATGTFWYGMLVATVAVLRHLGVDPIYHARLDVPIVFLFVMLYIITFQILVRKAYYDWSWGRDALEDDKSTTSKNMKRISDRRRSSVIEDEIRMIQEDDPAASIMSTAILLGGMFFNIILYPTVIIPYLNADATDDSARVLVIAIGLSILTEVTLMIMRFANIKTTGEDFNIRASVADQNALMFFESTCIITRRILLGCMRSQQAVFFAIGIMSLEEGVLRSTFAVRELWYRRFRNQPPASDAELARLKVGWAVQIANSMHCEIFAIFLGKLLVIAAR